MNLSIPTHLENYIGGNFVAPLNNQYLDCINPATAEVFAQIPDSNEQDVDAAVLAAKKAFQLWSVTPIEERFKILNRIADFTM